jgi:hypothetical protein
MLGSTATLMWGLLFGSIGMGYLVFGRRQRRGVAFVSGVVLCTFPYFVSNVYLIILIGILFMLLPYFIKY